MNFILARGWELCMVYCLVNGRHNYIQVQSPHSRTLLVTSSPSSVRNWWELLANSTQRSVPVLVDPDFSPSLTLILLILPFPCSPLSLSQPYLGDRSLPCFQENLITAFRKISASSPEVWSEHTLNTENVSSLLRRFWSFPIHVVPHPPASLHHLRVPQLPAFFSPPHVLCGPICHVAEERGLVNFLQKV